MIVYQGNHSVLFEIGTLRDAGTAVLALIRAGAAGKTALAKPIRLLHKVTMPLKRFWVWCSPRCAVILGSLYLIMPQKCIRVVVAAVAVVLLQFGGGRGHGDDHLRVVAEFALSGAASKSICWKPRGQSDSVRTGCYLALKAIELAVTGELGLLFGGAG
ncbi:MAG: hypothetical protein U0559_01205 [Anaerolineae bacterium]